MINQKVPFYTDTATIAVFDPAVIEHRIGDGCDWWCEDDLSKVKEVSDGRIALINIKRDSSYELRITDGELNGDERSYAAHCCKDIGVVVTSGELYIGPGECIPGDAPLDEGSVERGALIEVPNGEYMLDAYSLFYAATKKFWKADLSDLDMDIAPSDFVLVLRHRDDGQAFVRIQEEMAVAGSFESWVFPDEPRQVGPELGMILKSRARMNEKDELVFENCGPGFYTPKVIENIEGISEWDDVYLEVTHIDHENVEFNGINQS